MFERNRRLGWFRLVAGLLLLAVLIGGGYMLFQAGFSQGAIAAGDGEFAFHDLPYGPRGYYPMHGRIFFPGGFFLGLLFLFLVFGLFRRMVFGPRWGMHRMHGMYGKGGRMWKEKTEAWHEELHQKMESPNEDSADQPTDEEG